MRATLLSIIVAISIAGCSSMPKSCWECLTGIAENANNSYPWNPSTSDDKRRMWAGISRERDEQRDREVQANTAPTSP
jgi:hypothetical protein